MIKIFFGVLCGTLIGLAIAHQINVKEYLKVFPPVECEVKQ